MRWLYVLSLVYLVINVTTGKSTCPANTFACTDGSCIPEDWVGDGEADCDDRSDEIGHTTNRTKEEDPFDEIVTLPPHLRQSSKERQPSTEADRECPYEHQVRIDQCAEPVLLFLHDVNAIYFENTSLLSDKDTQKTVEKGCDLMQEYSICTQGTSKACSVDEGVQAWREGCVTVDYIDFYRQHRVKIFSFRFNSDCSEPAMEMLQPIIEESQHVTSSLRCRDINEISLTTEMSIDDDETVVEEDHTTTTVTVTNALTTKIKSTAMNRTIGPVVQITADDLPMETTTVPIAVGHVQLKINMSDAVNALYYIYDVCSSSYTKSPFATVATKICGRQDEIAKHSDCYQNTLEKAKCTIKDAKNECEALESFNSNLDCAIVTMNDVCEVEAQNLVIELQEAINDLVIEKKCFETREKETATPAAAANKDEFHLTTKMTHCTDDQENNALSCLVELLEINKQLAQFQNLNFLLEISTENSTIVTHICDLYSKYEKCLKATVFINEKRCAFSSPLNTLARIGLAPICSIDSRPLLSSHRECLSKLASQAEETSNCQSGLAGLGNTVNMMMQMSQIGEEEGCPHEPPTNLDEIIARPVTRQTLPPIQRRPGAAPMARPLNTVSPSESGTQPTSISSFEQCVRPLTAFQPHPLSVIKVPRQIDEACEEFKKFQNCVEDIKCHPLWARGMTAMFSYACGEGAEGYKKVRQCLRKVSAEENVKECVTTFSRGAPTQACLSANALLSCAIAPIQTECGEETSGWIIKYVTKFATAIDPRCKLASQLPIGKVIGVGCSAEEEAIIDHCAAPLNDIGTRMEELFQGGLQAMMKNVNSLAPVFAGGCNLTDEFRQCASFLLSGRTPCVISSCMIRAGEGICTQPDPTKAIDDNLSCVFAQIQEPSFAKCVRSTLTRVKQFTLNSFRNVLPKFIECTEELVRAKCGEIPIKILRAMSSPDICPVGPAPIVPVNRPQATPSIEQQIPTCTSEKRASYEQCTRPFYSRYRMLPVTLLNESENMDQVCTDVSIMDGCSISTQICSSPEQTALKKMIEQLCATREVFDQHKICLKSIINSKQGASCMSEFMTSSPNDRCTAIQNAANCMAKHVRDSCGDDAFTYTFTTMSDYARMIDNQCVIDKPTVLITTGCSEQDMVTYLSCESSIDPFSFRPVSIIGDGSKWDEMCTAFNTSYKPCVEKMTCRFEPISSANIQLFDGICNRPLTLRDQKSYGRCLSDYTNKAAGQKCISTMASIDPMASDAPIKMCQALNSILTCAGNDIEKECGYDALLHVYEQHTQWAQAYNKSCVIQSPKLKPISTNTLDRSRDVEPVHVVRDETTPSSVQKDATPTVLTTDSATPEIVVVTTDAEAEPMTTTHPKDITTTAKDAITYLPTSLLVFLVTLQMF
ncbi:Low-density lipoprotein receptor domain class A [Dictyocaulus viviparus]|uniref:Low-density lipoprotein receptor domain class A n=1 Tax=Dictyocaulus viviparus TaxID=29172 RepID=A0A0D8XYW7_DICVI|nr:Low-density lipoprotein receptor domain class A [Dictyocaulus viviparus]